MPFKINVTNNIQSGNHWKNLSKNHISRGFESHRNGRDSNKNINPVLSPLNQYSWGKLQHIKGEPAGINKQIIFKNTKIKRKKIKKILKSHAQKYVYRHNNLKSVRNNPSKRITWKNLMYNGRNNRPVYRTGVMTIGTADSADKMIKTIQKSNRRWNYFTARKRWARAMGNALVQWVYDYNKKNNFTKIISFGTNVDENRKSTDNLKPGAPHIHYKIIGLGQTKLSSNGTPTEAHISIDKHGKKHHHSGSHSTFSVTAGLKMQYHTSNFRKAFKRFRKNVDDEALKIVSKELKTRFTKVPLFQQKFQLTRTNSKDTGKSMTQYKHDKAIEDEVHSSEIKRINRQKKRLKYQKSKWNRQKYNRKKYRQNNNSLASMNQSLITESDSLNTEFSEDYQLNKKNLISYYNKIDLSASVSASNAIKNYKYFESFYASKAVNANETTSSANNTINFYEEEDNSMDINNFENDLPNNNYDRIYSYQIINRKANGNTKVREPINHVFRKKSKNPILTKIKTEKLINNLESSTVKEIPNKLMNHWNIFWSRLSRKLNNAKREIANWLTNHEPKWLRSHHIRFAQENNNDSTNNTNNNSSSASSSTSYSISPTVAQKLKRSFNTEASRNKASVQKANRLNKRINQSAKNNKADANKVNSPNHDRTTFHGITLD